MRSDRYFEVFVTAKTGERTSLPLTGKSADEACRKAKHLPQVGSIKGVTEIGRQKYLDLKEQRKQEAPSTPEVEEKPVAKPSSFTSGYKPFGDLGGIH